MDPISMIVLAVVKGAAAKLGSNIADEGYRRLRSKLVEDYGNNAEVVIKRIERDPNSAEARFDLERGLRSANAQYESDLTTLAQGVLDLLDGGSLPALESPLRADGIAALQRVIQEHVDQLLAARAAQRIKDADLIGSSVATNRGLSEEVRRSAKNLHGKIRLAIEQTAQKIENERYRGIESAVAEIAGSVENRERSQGIVSADKAIHVSYETLRLTVEFFGEFNRIILNRIDRPQSAVQLSNSMLVTPS